MSLVRSLGLEACRVDDQEGTDRSAFARIAALLARLLDVPIAAVSLVDGPAIRVQAAIGVPCAAWPREGSLCGVTLARGVPVAFPDLRVAAGVPGPITIDGRPLRSYAGAPIRGPDGDLVGTLCAAGFEPRAFPPEDRRLVEALAEIVGDRLLLRRRLAELAASSAALEAGERRFRDFAEAGSDWFWETDGELRFTWLSDNVRTLFGVAPEWHYGKTRLELARSPADLAIAREVHERMLRREPFTDVEYCRRSPAGDHWLRISGRPAFDPGGRFIGYRGIGRDIGELKRAEAARREAEERYRRLVELSPDGIVIHVEDRVVFANAAAVGILGGSRPEDVIGLSPLDLCEPEHREAVSERIRRLAAPGTVLEPFEFRVRALDGRAVEVEARGVAVLEGGRTAAQLVLRDVTERRALEAELRRLAHHDPLTGLPNRALFFDRLGGLLRLARRERGRGALLLLDLDGFKLVNDSFGHDCGDALLCATARRLEGCVRASDTVARLAGDEFAVLLYPVEGPAAVAAVGQRIVAALAEPARCAGRLVAGATSIGAALFPEPADAVELVVKHADLALYRAKASGRGAVVLFDRELHATTESGRRLAEQLARALHERALELYFQPRLDLVRGACCGMEAVLRWRHPEDGLLEAARFVPVAEASGLGPDLARLAIEHAADQLAAWRAEGLAVGRLAVNVSASQLAQPGFDGWSLATFAARGLEPTCLLVEVAEPGLAGRQGERAEATLRRLRASGVQVALDDFGTGATSLVDLRRRPVDMLKLHETLVRDLPAGPPTEPILRAVVDMAHGLGLSVTAEGVEHEAEAQALRRLGCDHAQGRLWAPPLPAELARRWLAAATAPPRAP